MTMKHLELIKFLFSCGGTYEIFSAIANIWTSQIKNEKLTKSSFVNARQYLNIDDSKDYFFTHESCSVFNAYSLVIDSSLVFQIHFSFFHLLKNT